MVQGQANLIKLHAANIVDYFGHVYVGEHYRDERVIYDTASSWITIDDINVPNADLVSNYDHIDSTSATPVYEDDDKTEPSMIDVNFGTYIFEGQQYTDKMCLTQNMNDRTDYTGRLCVRNMPFVLVTGIIGSFAANGVVGLAPHMHDKSYINQLYMQG